MKEVLTDKLKAGLSNLSEKLFDGYTDAPINIKEIPDTWIKIAEDLVKKIKEYKFKKNDRESLHPFLKCEKELANELGFDNITVCPYKGQEFPMTYCASNFIYDGFDNHKSLTIDIYNVYYLEDPDKILLHLILQEMQNFKRDASWINEGLEIYNENMEMMKNHDEILN